MSFLKSLLLLVVFISNAYSGGAKVEQLFFQNEKGEELEFSIKMEKGFRGIPKLEVKKNILQVSIPESQVWPKIEKQVTIGSRYDTKLMAYQFNKDLVRFRAILPQDITKVKDLVSLTMEGDRINVKVPRAIFGKKKSVVKNSTKKVKAVKKENVNKYDESYLEKLFQDRKIAEQKINEKGAITKENDKKVNELLSKTTEKTNDKNVITDKVGLVESSLEDQKEFSMTSYIGKFVAFLALILVGFYLVITLMKKGVLKKGKLGFLNSTKVVEVLNTTYIGPKRSISVIKAHNQVFLIGNSEKGIHFLSEIKDVAGLLKNGELDLAGSNFDTAMNGEDNNEKNFNLKQVLTESTPVEKEESSVKNQITAKLKNLKSLQ